MLSLSGDNVSLFTLYQNELFLRVNVTRDFTAQLVITAVDQEDFGSRIDHLVLVTAKRDWSAVGAGIGCGVVLFVMFLAVIMFRHCSVQRYKLYDRVTLKTHQKALLNRSDQIVCKSPHRFTKTAIDLEKEPIPEAEANTRFGPVRRVKSKLHDSDSGRGESSSETQSGNGMLGQWCQPECLTLGHSDRCWLPRLNGENQFIVDVPPATRTKTNSLSVWDERSDSCYSSHNEAENETARQKQNLPSGASCVNNSGEAIV